MKNILFIIIVCGLTLSCNQQNHESSEKYLKLIEEGLEDAENKITVLQDSLGRIRSNYREDYEKLLEKNRNLEKLYSKMKKNYLNAVRELENSNDIKEFVSASEEIQEEFDDAYEDLKDQTHAFKSNQDEIEKLKRENNDLRNANNSQNEALLAELNSLRNRIARYEGIINDYESKLASNNLLIKELQEKSELTDKQLATLDSLKIVNKDLVANNNEMMDKYNDLPSYTVTLIRVTPLSLKASKKMKSVNGRYAKKYVDKVELVFKFIRLKGEGKVIGKVEYFPPADDPSGNIKAIMESDTKFLDFTRDFNINSTYTKPFSFDLFNVKKIEGTHKARVTYNDKILVFDLFETY